MNPYTALKKTASEWADKVTKRCRVRMWFYPSDRLDEVWSISALKERVAAANQLGYDVELVSREDGLHVEYVKKIPNRPYLF